MTKDVTAVRCGCTPGDDENGWHETRSDACLAVERAAFTRALDHARAWARNNGDGSQR